MKWNLYVEFPILAVGNLLIKGGGWGGGEIQYLNPILHTYESM